MRAACKSLGCGVGKLQWILNVMSVSVLGGDYTRKDQVLHFGEINDPCNLATSLWIIPQDF